MELARRSSNGCGLFEALLGILDRMGADVLRRRTEAEGQRSFRIDLNMKDPYQALYREASRLGRSMRKWVEVRPTSTKPFRR